jgi:phosphatidylglycerophosphatase A
MVVKGTASISMQYALWKYPVHFLAHGFGAGLVPSVAGALGALVGAAAFWLFSRLKAPAYAAVTVILFLAGIFICGQTARDLAAVDPHNIVFDEIVGFLAAMYRVPRKFEWVVPGLIVFVALDAWKPWPIHLLENIPATGTAIMADDFAAGLVTLAILHLVRVGYRRLAR